MDVPVAGYAGNIPFSPLLGQVLPVHLPAHALQTEEKAKVVVAILGT